MSGLQTSKVWAASFLAPIALVLLASAENPLGTNAAPDPAAPFPAPGPPPYATAPFSNPLWTLTAADGDELWVEGEGVAVLSLADGSLRARGRQRIIGGTGRFAGATGEVEAQGLNEDGQGPDDFGSNGWIRFQASDRAAR